MINVIIQDDYRLFRYGVEAVLLQLANKYHKKITISYEFDSAQTSHADVIIKSVLGSEINMCHIIPYKRYQRCIVILIVDNADSVKNLKRAICLSRAVIIERTIAPAMLVNIFTQLWSDIECSKGPIFNYCFEGCSPFTLNGSQLKIVSLLYDDYSFKKIATLLNVGVKSVYAHKYKLMKALNLESNYHLFQFLRFYHKKYGLHHYYDSENKNDDFYL